MFKILTALFPFIKEIFFDDKSEMDFKSPHFDIKKWLRYVLFILSLVFLIFSVGRLYSITLKYVKLKRDYEHVTKQSEEASAVNKTLAQSLEDLKQKNRILLEQCYHPAKPVKHHKG
jgi:hypothetical protein